MAYFPFESDQLDHVGSYSLTGNWTQTTLWYTFSVTTNINNINWINFRWCRYKLNSVNVNKNYNILMNTNLWYCGYTPWQAESRYRGNISVNNSSWGIIWQTAWMSMGEWHYLAFSYINSELLVCKDWVTSVLTSQTPYNFGDNMLLLNNYGSWWSGNTTYSQLIIESVGRTAQEIADYYNQTKANYLWFN